MAVDAVKTVRRLERGPKRDVEDEADRTSKDHGFTIEGVPGVVAGHNRAVKANTHRDVYGDGDKRAKSDEALTLRLLLRAALFVHSHTAAGRTLRHDTRVSQRAP